MKNLYFLFVIILFVACTYEAAVEFRYPVGITSFGLMSSDNLDLVETCRGVISNDTITLRVPYGMPRSNLIPYFTFAGDDIRVDTVMQTSRSNGHDFTQPVMYRVFGKNGYVREYSVSVQNMVFAADLVFIVDSGGSMGHEMDTIKAVMNDLVSSIETNEKLDFRFAVVRLTDYLRIDMDMSSDIATLKTYISELITGTGYLENMLEPMRMLVGGANYNTFYPSSPPPVFRADAKKIFVFFTDEDSDSPNNNANLVAGQSQSSEPSQPLTAPWYTEVSNTAHCILSNDVQVHMFLSFNESSLALSHSNMLRQYGSPDASVQNADYSGFNPSETLSNLGNNLSSNSFQKQVLQGGGIVRAYHLDVTGVVSADLINNMIVYFP